MPKVRPTVDIVRDAQKHLTVAKSRLSRENNSNGVISLINQASILIDQAITKLPQDEESSWDKLVSNEIILIKKDAIKEIPKINAREAIRAIYNCINTATAVQTGKQHGLNNDQIMAVIKKAPPETNLGKAIRAKTKPTPSPAVIAPQPIIVVEDDNDTIVSDPIPDDLKQLLGSE